MEACTGLNNRQLNRTKSKQCSRACSRRTRALRRVATEPAARHRPSVVAEDPLCHRLHSPASCLSVTTEANSTFHPFGVDKLSSEPLYRMCAGRTMW